MKDHIASVEGIANISRNKQLLSSVKSARLRDKSDLNTKRKLDQAAHSKKNSYKELESFSEKIGLIIEQTELKKWFDSSSRMDHKGNQNFQNEFNNPKMSKEKL